jgi:hypothetical protein
MHQSILDAGQGQTDRRRPRLSVDMGDQWRAQAIARMDRDPFVFDELCSIYPDWTAIVDDLVEADRKRPLKKSS